MPADSYRIVARITAEDATAGAAQGAQRRMAAVEASATRAGATISSQFARAFAVIGGAAGVGFAVRGVLRLHSTLEQAQVGMATLLSAQTGTEFATSLGAARGIVQGLRQDAAQGVGELTDYLTGFQTLLGPALGLGATTEQVRELTKTALAAGFALRGPQGLWLASMDVAQALTGQIGERTTPIVMQAIRAIGMSAEAFRGLRPEERMAALSRAFAMFGPGIEAMGKTWDAQFSTLLDNLKQLIVAVTTPLFERWTGQLQRANVWLATHRDTLTHIADVVGPRLVEVYKSMATWALIAAGAQFGPGLVRGGRAGAGAVAGAAPGVVAAVRDPLGFGKLFAGALGGSTAGMTSGVFAGLRGLVNTIGRAAGPIAVVTGAFLALQGAFREFSGIASFVAVQWAGLIDSVVALGSSFDLLSSQGSALNLAGAALATVLGGVLFAVSSTVKALASLVTGLAVVFRVIGEGVQLLWAAWTGNLAGVKSARTGMFSALTEGQEQLRRIWMPTAADRAGAAGGADAGGGAGAIVPKSIVNINGPVRVEVRAERLDDPARVAVAFETVLDLLQRNPRQARRIPSLSRA